MEFVKDKKTKESFSDDVKFGVQVGKNALKKGLIIRYDPNWVAFAPPLIIRKEELDEMLKIFSESLEEVSTKIK